MSIKIKQVYKKFDKGFAEKHALKIALQCQKKHASEINMWTDLAMHARNEEEWRTCASNCNISVSRYAAFLISPYGMPLFINRSYADRAIAELSDSIEFDTSMQAEIISDDQIFQINQSIEIIKKFQ